MRRLGVFFLVSWGTGWVGFSLWKLYSWDFYLWGTLAKLDPREARMNEVCSGNGNWVGHLQWKKGPCVCQDVYVCDTTLLWGDRARKKTAKKMGSSQLTPRSETGYLCTIDGIRRCRRPLLMTVCGVWNNVTLGIVWDAMRVNGIGQCSKGQIVLMRDFETPECRGLLCLRSNDRFCLIVRLSR